MGGTRGRRIGLCLAGAAAILLAAASPGFTCASVTSLDFDPKVAQPGQQVTVLVTFVNKDKPVDLRWDTLDGPLLTTIDPATFTEGLHGNWRFATGTITVPADAKAGNHLVIAHQEAVRGTATWGMPARGLIQISGAGTPLVGQEAGPPPEVRPQTLVTEDSMSGGTLALVALGAAGFTMLIAGVGVILASGRRGRPVAVVER